MRITLIGFGNLGKGFSRTLEQKEIGRAHV